MATNSPSGPVKCNGFEPQRFRPLFCKTCYKSKQEHSGGNILEQAATAPLPPPIASALSHSDTTPSSPHHTSQERINSHPVDSNGQRHSTPKLNRVKSQNSAQLRRPMEIKKGSPPVSTIHTTPPVIGQRKSLSINQNSLKKFKSMTNSAETRPQSSGFIHKQIQKGETPDATKFFLQSLRGLLQDGIGLSSGETEDLTRRVIAKSLRADDNPILLLNKQKMGYFLDMLEQCHSFLDEQRRLKSIITVQSLARRFLVTKRFRKMSAADKLAMRARNNVFIDIVRTEKNHIQALDALISNFMLGIRQSDLVAPHECAYIFSNIEVVAAEHRLLYQRLVSAADDWPFIGNVGAVFLEIKGLLNAISLYVSNFKNAMNEVERLTLENPRFEHFCEITAADDMDLSTRLALPVNRIAQYEYVLRSLADTTPEGSKEREDLENAFAVLAQSSLVVQTSLVQSSEVAQIRSVQRKLKGDGPVSLVKAGRLYLSEHRFKKLSVFLFNDCLVVAKNPTGSKSLKKNKNKDGDFYRVKKISDLKTCSVIDTHTDNKSLELKCEGEVYKLSGTTADIKTNFINAFNGAVAELNRVKVFGVSLVDTLKREKTSVPIVMTKVVDYLRTNLKQPGMFRVAGAKKEIESLREAFDVGGEEVAAIKFQDKNIFSVCDLLKQYLRCLPEPLLGYKLYKPLVDLMKQNADETTRVNKIREELKTNTPKENMNVLIYLIDYLTEVVTYSEENKMTASNLSIVFGPTLLWPETNSLESAMDMPYVNSVVQLIIEHPKLIIPK